MLFALRLPFMSHELNLMRGDTYDPDYVSIRIEGCAAAGLPLANSHGHGGAGSTAVESTGCDPCVVPTIVDARNSAVHIDSRNIALMLASAPGGEQARLLPAHLRADIERQLRIIDNLPNYPLLAVFVSGGREGAAASRSAFARGKVERCEALIAQHRADPRLLAAYRAKRDKEHLAASQLFDDDALTRAERSMADAVEELARALGPGHRYLFGDFPTLADLFWAVELIRLNDLGMDHVWADGKYPAVERYFNALCNEPSIDQAVMVWPGARIGPKPGASL